MSGFLEKGIAGPPSCCPICGSVDCLSYDAKTGISSCYCGWTNKKKRHPGDTRAEVLEFAKKCVCEIRGQEYGGVEDNFALIADMWSVYLGVEITPVDVALMMAQLKMARIKTGTFKEDSFVDACGYIACAAELAKGE